jgi:hypothetical protein
VSNVIGPRKYLLRADNPAREGRGGLGGIDSREDGLMPMKDRPD